MHVAETGESGDKRVERKKNQKRSREKTRIKAGIVENGASTVLWLTSEDPTLSFDFLSKKQCILYFNFLDCLLYITEEESILLDSCYIR